MVWEGEEMIEIVIEYSEDFEDNDNPRQVYSTLHDRGYLPKSIHVDHVVSRGITSVRYTFGSEVILPKQSELESLLGEFNLSSIKIVEDKKPTAVKK